MISLVHATTRMFLINDRCLASNSSVERDNFSLCESTVWYLPHYLARIGFWETHGTEG